MSNVSLFTVGTDTLAPKWPVKPGFHPSEWANNAGAQGSGKFLYNILAEARRLYSKPNLLLAKEI
jgi:hypothetical protein